MLRCENKIKMSFKIPREKIERVVGVILRVPALFIAEAWYRTDPSSMQHVDGLSKNANDRLHVGVFTILYYTGMSGHNFKPNRH